MSEEMRAYDVVDAEVTSKMLEWVQEREQVRLMEYRVKLCDLLWGRFIRDRAGNELQNALEMEALGAPIEAWGQSLDRAAHWEWMARMSEQGQVLWGQRNNRLGRPEDV